jgi:hypothetical protein
VRGTNAVAAGYDEGVVLMLIDTPPLQGSAVTHDTGALP